MHALRCAWLARSVPPVEKQSTTTQNKLPLRQYSGVFSLNRRGFDFSLASRDAAVLCFTGTDPVVTALPSNDKHHARERSYVHFAGTAEVPASRRIPLCCHLPSSPNAKEEFHTNCSRNLHDCCCCPGCAFQRQHLLWITEATPSPKSPTSDFLAHCFVACAAVSQAENERHWATGFSPPV